MYCTENWEKILTERKLQGLNPNFYIPKYLWAIYIFHDQSTYLAAAK